MASNLRSLLIPLVLINAAAVLIGAYFYADQVSATAPQLLAFVPDCPLFVLLSIPILLGMMRNGPFSFFVSIGMVKYGLWTMFALLFHWGHYSSPLFFWTSVIFILGHAGMALEGLAILPGKRVGASALALSIIIFLAGDYSDYWLGTAPAIPQEGIGLVRGFSIASSVALPLLLFACGEKIRGLPLVRQLRGIIGA